MNKAPAVQYASIQQPFGCNPPIVHCPICGQASITLDEAGFGSLTACEHLAFIYVGAAGDYEYQSENFAERLDGIEDPEDEFEDLYPSPEMLVALGYSDMLLALEITYGGMANGPVSFTDVFGFDYGTLAPDA